MSDDPVYCARCGGRSLARAKTCATCSHCLACNRFDCWCDDDETVALRARIAELESQRGAALSERDALSVRLSESEDIAVSLLDQRNAALARVAELETERKRYGGEHRTDCPDCGEGVAIDEDGCCVTCGRDTDAYCGVIGSLVTRAGREHAECISAGAIMERDAAIAALRALVDALPTCDAHAPRHCTASVVPWADALTAALAVLEETP